MIGFALLRSVIGPEKSRHFLNQSDAKLKINNDLIACVFPRFRKFGCFIVSSHWPWKVFFLLLIGRSDYCAFGR